MPAIPLESVRTALEIFENSTFEAREKIGAIQNSPGRAPLSLFASRDIAWKLIDQGKLIINAEGKIDINQKNLVHSQ
jgi:hypothetical protein